MRKITACLLFALILNLCSCDNANAKNNQYDLITYGKDGITFGTTKNKVLNQKGKPENDYTTFIYYSADETINEDIKINSVWYYQEPP